MGKVRIIAAQRESFYHCMSRVVDKRFLFGEAEKRYFCHWMRRLEEFCGVEVVTYCIMSNHFHLLARVPEKAAAPQLTVKKLREILPLLYEGGRLMDILQELDRALESSDPRWVEQILERYGARRHDISGFIKELKQRFSQWYNHSKGREGTLWENRFKSVLVEGSEFALSAVAAYIDLNPVRAGMARDPKDYRWCGYAEAVAGGRRARQGLSLIRQSPLHPPGDDRGGSGGREAGPSAAAPWPEVAASYRLLLFGKGQEPGEAGRGIEQRGTRLGFSAAQVEAEKDRGGRLSLAEALRCRVRYFRDGAVIGSADFVEKVFTENRGRLGPKRKTGPRHMRGADWGGLRALRDLGG